MGRLQAGGGSSPVPIATPISLGTTDTAHDETGGGGRVVANVSLNMHAETGGLGRRVTIARLGLWGAPLVLVVVAALSARRCLAFYAQFGSGRRSRGRRALTNSPPELGMVGEEALEMELIPPAL